MSQDENFFDPNFYDTEDIEKTEQQKKQERNDWLKLLDDARWVLSSAKGRRFILWLFEITHIWRLSYAAKDSTQTAFNEGSKSIGLRVLHVIQNADPKSYSRLEDDRLADLGKRKKEQDHV